MPLELASKCLMEYCSILAVKIIPNQALDLIREKFLKWVMESGLPQIIASVTIFPITSGILRSVDGALDQVIHCRDFDRISVEKPSTCANLPMAASRSKLSIPACIPPGINALLELLPECI
jgi:hypothetical protein